jgi:hypothetical protein
MMREELNLARKVQQQVAVTQLAQPLLQPLYTGLQRFHTPHERPVGSKSMLAHRPLHRAQLSHVSCALVAWSLVGRVQVHNGHFAPNAA